MIRKLLLRLTLFLADLEGRQGWVPIPLGVDATVYRINRALDKVDFDAVRSQLALGFQCTTHGHRFDRFFENGEVCITCGKKIGRG